MQTLLMLFATFSLLSGIHQNAPPREGYAAEVVELLPDLTALPARDMRVKNQGDKTLLLFSTTYINKGAGSLELRGDPATQGVRKDANRNVLQRVYKSDGSYRDALVGNFLWHESHLHFHFTDFILYELAPVESNGSNLAKIHKKATFCVRDVSVVELPLPRQPPDANYRRCGRDLQGVSVGWGDSYLHTYPDQNLDVSNLKPGAYRLTMSINPWHRLAESDFGNNISVVTMQIDPAGAAVRVVEELPGNTPNIKHIYLEPNVGNPQRNTRTEEGEAEPLTQGAL